jgi:hypothetical protein
MLISLKSFIFTGYSPWHKSVRPVARSIDAGSPVMGMNATCVLLEKPPFIIFDGSGFIPACAGILRQQKKWGFCKRERGSLMVLQKAKKGGLFHGTDRLRRMH